MEMKAMRDALGAALVEIGKTNDKLMVLDADVSSSTKTGLFGKAYPDRFFNMGVAEANMVDVAAGMATVGYRPVVSAFAIFLALKATDQIRNVVCYNNLNVIIAGGYAGLSDSFDGASHQSITDIAIMRAFPNLTVLVPADAEDVSAVLEEALTIDGPVYIRMCRNPGPVIDKKRLSVGKAELLTEGDHLTIGACGMTVSLALEASKVLAAKGIKADILDMGSIKPMDEAAVLASVEKTGAFLAVEEHSVHGGMGSAVSELLARKKPVPMDFVGIEDCFTESGPYDELLEKYGISVSAIVDKAEKLCSE